MSEKDRQRRLGDASSLQDAIRSLGKVSEEHRIGFIHDRLMSAIDDICEQHQKANAAKFTPNQIIVLKDIAFAMVYILDPKSQKNQSFSKRLFLEFKEQSPLKQVGLVAGTIATLAAAIGGIYGGVHTIFTYYMTSDSERQTSIHSTEKTNVPGLEKTNQTHSLIPEK